MTLHDRILVATDLSARSDRALDRAIMLSAADASNLVVLHVIEDAHKRHSRDVLDASIRARLIHDLGTSADQATIRIEEGDPVDVIHEVAREYGVTLVVLGVEHTERLGRSSLGDTADRLVRSLDQPLLLVAERPRLPYAKVAVAVDFSPLSMKSVALAAQLFPKDPITVFHACEPLATYGAADIEAHREGFRSAAEGSYVDWLGDVTLPLETRQRLRPHIVLGEPARVIRKAAEVGAFDLIVITTRAHGRIFEFFIGSVARRMLAELPCDALLIRESQMQTATAPAASEEEEHATAP